jgi:hypothetical protein
MYVYKAFDFNFCSTPLAGSRQTSMTKNYNQLKPRRLSWVFNFCRTLSTTLYNLSRLRFLSAAYNRSHMFFKASMTSKQMLNRMYGVCSAAIQK